ncbi:bifunctional Zinc finger C2H2-type/Zinc finger [Babesia duncani]|uniref:Bifunctional Zinc finger C2H2-type/Zinc finger n=1 Tax=Babesia duncani TaxID=323732 RepID=A0AAD9PHC9_9APIC|nr:bifunctional Zinc finger C2H2-type/Zinc finger [Babesia duncani]
MGRNMLKLDLQTCTLSSIKIGAGIFCKCGVPYTSRFRIIPCHHVICNECKDSAVYSSKCSECQSPLDDVETIHPNDELLKCTIKGCNKGFLNFPSLKLHCERQHNTSAFSIDDFYMRNGDFVATNTNKVISTAQQDESHRPINKQILQSVENDAGILEDDTDRAISHAYHQKDADEELEDLM